MKKILITVIPKQNASTIMEALPVNAIQGTMVMEPPVSVSTKLNDIYNYYVLDNPNESYGDINILHIIVNLWLLSLPV